MAIVSMTSIRMGARSLNLTSSRSGFGRFDDVEIEMCIAVGGAGGVGLPPSQRRFSQTVAKVGDFFANVT